MDDHWNIQRHLPSPRGIDIQVSSEREEIYHLSNITLFISRFSLPLLPSLICRKAKYHIPWGEACRADHDILICLILTLFGWLPGIIFLPFSLSPTLLLLRVSSSLFSPLSSLILSLSFFFLNFDSGSFILFY